MSKYINTEYQIGHLKTDSQAVFSLFDFLLKHVISASRLRAARCVTDISYILRSFFTHFNRCDTSLSLAFWYS